MRRPSPWAVLSAGALVLAVAGVISEFRNPVGGDPASLLYGAERVLDGAKLYTDLIDLNPPFTFLFHTLPVLASRVLGLEAISCFRVFVCCLVVLSGVTLIATLRRAAISAGAWHALVAAFLLGSLGLVVGFFGEREHLQFVLMYPYLALASVRAGGGMPSRRLGAWTGLLAGTGLALKVTAGLVPILIAAVLWFAARLRSDESWWALGMLALCTVAGLVWAPGYLETVRAFGAFYHGFSLLPYSALLFSRWMLAPLVVAPCLLLLALPVMRFRLGTLTWFAGVLGFVASVLAQGKGFPYHYFPARSVTMTVVLLVLASGTFRRGRLDALRRAFAGAALLVLMAVPVTVAWGRISRPRQVVDDFGGAAFRMLRDAPTGTTVAIHSSRLGDAFPLVNVRGLTLTGRYPHLWFMYPYDSSASGRMTRVVPYSDSILTPVERRLRHGVAEDLFRDQPRLLLVRDSSASGTVLRYLCDDSLYRRAAADYRPVRRSLVMRLFARDPDAAAGACTGY